MPSIADERSYLDQDDPVRQGLDLIQQGLTIFDGDMRLVSCNRGFVTMFDLPHELARPGTRFEQINQYLARRGEFGPGDPDELVRVRIELARRFEPHYLERTRPNGQRISVEGHPLRSGGWVTIYSDITETWKQEQVLRARSDSLSDKLLMRTEAQARTNRELAAANRALQQTQASLQASESRIRTITGALPAHIAYVDRDYTYRFSNHRLDDVMSLGTANVLGRTVDETFPPATAQLLRRKLDAAFGGQVVTFDHVTHEGEPHAQAVRTTLSPETNGPGEVIGAFVLSINVSAEKAATEMQVRAKRMETSAQLTSGLAHDFSNILTVILGNLHRMGRDAAPAHAELLQSTERAARRGTRIIDNLMALLYRHRLDARRADVGKLLRDLVPLFSSLNERIGLELQLPAGDLIATVDEGALQDVVLNILFNAKDAIEMTSGQGRIILHAEIDGAGARSGAHGDGTLRITVTDTGEGFSDEALDCATDPFFSTKPQGKGSGLGLSMVRSIVDQAGGELQIGNLPGAGARVALAFPLPGAGAGSFAPDNLPALVLDDLHAPVAAPESSRPIGPIGPIGLTEPPDPNEFAAANANAQLPDGSVAPTTDTAETAETAGTTDTNGAADPTAPPLRAERAEPSAAGIVAEPTGPLALIVDDDAEIRVLLRERLSARGWSSVEAADADEAMALLEQLPAVAMLITDIVMPGSRNGLELALHVQRRHPRIGVLVVSGLPRGATLWQRARISFPVIRKPFDAATFDAQLLRATRGQPA